MFHVGADAWALSVTRRNILYSWAFISFSGARILIAKTGRRGQYLKVLFAIKGDNNYVSLANVSGVTLFLLNI